MAQMVVPFKYKAFLSYSHRDKAWGEWLHRALESHRIDKDLIGRETPAGPVPNTLRPIFRDRDDFSAGPSLTEQTIAALEASQFLIVVCSPNAAKSDYVNEEIHRFKAMGRPGRVIAIIVDGKPDDAQHECFPPALRFKIGPDGTLTNVREQPIAADARPEGDGKDLAKHKIVAGLLAVGLDEIVKRAARAQAWRNRVWAGLAVLFLMLAVAAGASAVVAWRQLQVNADFLNASLQTTTDIVDTAVAQAERYRVPRVATLELLKRADGMFDNMARLGRATPELHYRKALMLIQFSRNFEVLGNSEERSKRIEEAQALLVGLSTANPRDPNYKRTLRVLSNERGDLLLSQGRLPEAVKNYEEALATSEQLVASDPGNTEWRRELLVSNIKIGGILLYHKSDATTALVRFRAALGASEQLLQVAPENVLWQADSGVVQERLGDALSAQGKLVEALSAYHAFQATLARLVANDPDSISRRHALTFAHMKVGDVMYRQNNHTEALAAYKDAQKIREQFINADPDNTQWLILLSQGQERIASAFHKLGNQPEALQGFTDSLAIRSRLAASDPNNANWQRDVSMSHNWIARVHVSMGNLDEALKSFRNGLAIKQRLAKTAPTDIRALHELAGTHEEIGEILLKQRAWQEALSSHLEELSTRVKLSADAPNNRQFHVALADTFSTICWLRAILNELPPALADCGRSLELRPDHAKTLDSRGLVFLRMDQYGKAIADYDSALRLAPKMATSLYGRGLARIRDGETTGGEADLAAAIAIRPGIAEEFRQYGIR